MEGDVPHQDIVYVPLGGVDQDVNKLGVVFSAYMVTAWGKPADVSMDGKGLTVTKLHVIPRARMEGSVCHQVTVPAPLAGEEEDAKKLCV